MLQASLPECSQEAYRGFTGSHLSFKQLGQAHSFNCCFFFRAVAKELMVEQWRGD